MGEAAISGRRGTAGSPRRLCSSALRAFRGALASAMRAIGRASPKVSSPQRAQCFRKAAAVCPACFAAAGEAGLPCVRHQDKRCFPGVRYQEKSSGWRYGRGLSMRKQEGYLDTSFSELCTHCKMTYKYTL